MFRWFSFLLIIAIISSCGNSNQEEQIFFIGGYTSAQFNGKGDGIYVCSLNNKSGKMALLSTHQVADPSYLAVHPNGKYLYAATEAGGENPGIITALKFDKKANAFEMINRIDSGGDYPCHISLSNDNKFLLVANYGDGSVVSIPIKEDGGLSSVSGAAKHQGKGPFNTRQEGPHAHYFGMGVNDSSVFAVDLGLDKVIHYRLENDGTLDSLMATETMSGTGPRHLVFHPEKKWCYVLSEFTNKIEAFSFSSENQPFERFQVLGTTEYNMPFYTSLASAIKIHPTGKYLYAGNRGTPTGDENSISAFSINSNNGKLELLGTFDSNGEIPRDFEIDPSGNYLIATNQFSGNVVSFKINQGTGMLEETGFQLIVNSGTCVKFLE